MECEGSLSFSALGRNHAGLWLLFLRDWHMPVRLGGLPSAKTVWNRSDVGVHVVVDARGLWTAFLWYRATATKRISPPQEAPPGDGVSPGGSTGRRHQDRPVAPVGNRSRSMP